MPLVHRDEKPTTGLSVHESTMRAPPGRHHPSPGAHSSRRDSRNCTCVCAGDLGGPASVSPSAASKRRTHTRLEPAPSVLSSRSCSSSRRLLAPFPWQRARNLVFRFHDTILKVGCLKPRWQCRAKKKKYIGSLQSKCSSLGLWVLYMNVLWETSKEHHHSQLGLFKEWSSPQKGNSLKSVLWLRIKPSDKLGKRIEGKKRSEKDAKASTPAKQKPGGEGNIFLYRYRLKNDIRHLWQLASELLVCKSHLSLPGVFKVTLYGLWNFRSDVYPHQVVVIEMTTREKNERKIISHTF